MAASVRSRATTFATSYSSLLPAIGNPLSNFSALLPTLAVASPPPVHAEDVGHQVFPTLVLPVGALGSCEAWTHPCASSSAWWVPGFAALPRMEQPTIRSQYSCLLPHGSLGKSYGVVMGMAGAASAGLVFCNGNGNENDDAQSSAKKNDKGGGEESNPPPPPDGNGNGGLGGKDRDTLLKLLAELQQQVKRYLEDEELAEDLKAHVMKRRESMELDVNDLAETQALIESLIKELKGTHNVHVLIKKMEAVATKLIALESKLFEKNRFHRMADKLTGEQSTSLAIEIFGTMGDIFRFFQNKLVVGVGLSACLTCKVGPYEGFYLALMALQDLIAEKRERLEKLQRRLGGYFCDPGNALEQAVVLKGLVEDQDAKIKSLEDKLGQLVVPAVDVPAGKK